jgi:hypothetical protein
MIPTIAFCSTVLDISALISALAMYRHFHVSLGVVIEREGRQLQSR